MMSLLEEEFSTVVEHKDLYFCEHFLVSCIDPFARILLIPVSYTVCSS